MPPGSRLVAMPSSLFCVDVLGRVHRLASHSASWEPLTYLGVEFKRLAAAENSLWAIGGDQQVYVFIHGSENPIRVKEETYENQVSGVNPSAEGPWRLLVVQGTSYCSVFACLGIEEMGRRVLVWTDQGKKPVPPQLHFLMLV